MINFVYFGKVFGNMQLCINDFVKSYQNAESYSGILKLRGPLRKKGESHKSQSYS